ncbi:MAG: helix-turn-helix transcriptional regulator [Gammaproteobacteria bacterium]
MQRVHRKLSPPEVEALRLQLAELVPIQRAGIPQLLRTMRLIVRKSQSEYARMCGVAPRVLASVESGTASPTVETLEKLLRPFGYRIGVVMEPSAEWAPSPVSHARKAKSGAPSESALSRALRKSRTR